jgi:hypothetical protein
MPVPAQNARASAALQAEFNTVGRLRTSVDEVIVPVALVADLSGTSTNPIRRACVRILQTAVVGQFFTARLELPTGVLGVVRRVIIQNNSGSRLMNVFFGSTVPAPATLGISVYTEGRLRASGQTPAGVLAFGTQVAALATIHNILFAGVPTEVHSEILNWPFGRTNAFDFIEFQADVANEQIIMAVEWDELPPVI